MQFGIMVTEGSIKIIWNKYAFKFLNAYYYFV